MVNKLVLLLCLGTFQKCRFLPCLALLIASLRLTLSGPGPGLIEDGFMEWQIYSVPRFSLNCRCSLSVFFSFCILKELHKSLDWPEASVLLWFTVFTPRQWQHESSNGLRFLTITPNILWKDFLVSESNGFINLECKILDIASSDSKMFYPSAFGSWAWDSKQYLSIYSYLFGSYLFG